MRKGAKCFLKLHQRNGLKGGRAEGLHSSILQLCVLCWAALAALWSILCPVWHWKGSEHPWAVPPGQALPAFVLCFPLTPPEELCVAELAAGR